MLKQLILLILTASVLSCSTLTLKDPEVNITSVDVANISAKDITLNLKLNIDNPNSVPLKLDKVSYALKFSGQDVTAWVIDQAVEIPANGKGDVIVPLRFQYNMVNNLISSFMKKTLEKEYELKGSAQLGILSIPFTKKGEVNLTQ
ncbi:MAG: LEA type 2 family protein [Bdellovibrio sp.]|nr:LEA type 2 family protein [Bdellovibrio sp.]